MVEENEDSEISVGKRTKIEVLGLKKPLTVSLKKLQIVDLGDLVEYFADNDAKTVIKEVRHMGVVNYNFVGQRLMNWGLIKNFVPVGDFKPREPSVEENWDGFLKIRGKNLLIQTEIRDLYEVVFEKEGKTIFSITVDGSVLTYFPDKT